jgi:hypothetical protein
VRPVVVHDQMQCDVLGELTVQSAQKLQPLLVTMPGLALSNDLSLQHIEGRE